MDGTSLNITQDLIQKLKEIVPQAFSEDKLDLQALQTLLGKHLHTDTERYSLSWAGKTEAYKLLQQATTATLLPQPDQSLDWDNTDNIFIEGENLEVLKVLQKSYYGKIKMIYIDPPYNTGNDSFIYPDKFSETKEEYLRRVGEKDEEGFMMKEGFFRKNNKENGQYHSNWLNMMLPRLFLARNLLKEDGVIFVSIDDNEQANLKLLMDEIFGEENFVAQNVWKKKQGGGNDSKYFIVEHEYILCYSRNVEKFKLLLDTEHTLDDSLYPFEDEKGDYGLVTLDKSSIQFSESLVFDITDKEGNIYKPRTIKGKKSCWRWGKEKVEKDFDELVFKNGNVYTKYYRPEGIKPKTMLSDSRFGRTETGKEEIINLLGTGDFSYPKPKNLIKHFIRIACNKSDTDLILDFFAGSGTTAQAVMELNEEDGGNRKYICVQLPEKTDEKSEAYKAGYRTIADITRARIEKVVEKIKKDRNGKLPLLGAWGGLGFRKYTLAASNFKIWRSDFIETEEDILQQMQLFAKPEKETSTTEDILWELLIKNGFPLTEKISKIELPDGSSLYHTAAKNAASPRMAFMLDKYSEELQSKILALKPKSLICLDSLFEHNDNLKTNAQLKFEDSGISFKTI